MAILFSSRLLSPKTSLILVSSLFLYSFIISGLLSSIKSTSFSIWSSLRSKSFFKFSPSRILVSTNWLKQSLSASSMKAHNSSSSISKSSIVITSGYLESAAQLTSFSILNSSLIFLKISIYSLAIVSLYLILTWFSLLSS